MLLLPAPKSVIELVKCSCITGCEKLTCSYQKANLSCTSMCKCDEIDDICSNRQTETQDEDDLDSEDDMWIFRIWWQHTILVFRSYISSTPNEYSSNFTNCMQLPFMIISRFIKHKPANCVCMDYSPKYLALPRFTKVSRCKVLQLNTRVLLTLR